MNITTPSKDKGYNKRIPKRGSRVKVEKCVIDFAKKLDPTKLEEAHAWYNTEMGKWCYNNVNHVGALIPEQLEIVHTTKGENVLIVLPICATRYIYYRHIPIISGNYHRIASTYV